MLEVKKLLSFPFHISENQGLFIYLNFKIKTESSLFLKFRVKNASFFD